MRYLHIYCSNICTCQVSLRCANTLCGHGILFMDLYGIILINSTEKYATVKTVCR